jgi:hypothetical protein
MEFDAKNTIIILLCIIVGLLLLICSKSKEFFVDTTSKPPAPLVSDQKAIKFVQEQIRDLEIRKASKQELDQLTLCQKNSDIPVYVAKCCVKNLPLEELSKAYGVPLSQVQDLYNSMDCSQVYTGI